MAGTDYNVALMMFFIPYVLFEVPSNILLAKFKKPSQYMGILVLSWGSIMTLMGVVQNFGGLCAARFFLGLCEAGFFPGAIYLVGQWYPPRPNSVSHGVVLLCQCRFGGFFWVACCSHRQNEWFVSHKYPIAQY